ncbi:hypothetical protein [Tianweitania sediminis]|uniref:Uncharacterized protein n=1 Tax=Tianweitania sediminis TaxID=1502156 RepID=A0A8J7R9G2_9HYPH|nr:hypothetical protein [Tianweitania sediminis]MBP0441310.1 hypothetical protein [Tianweitania sediminis]
MLAANDAAFRIQIIGENPVENELEEALLLLDLAAETSRGDGRSEILLKAWAVQAALKHRHGGARLNRDELWFVNRFTDERENIRWPRNYTKLLEEAGIIVKAKEEEGHEHV